MRNLRLLSLCLMIMALLALPAMAKEATTKGKVGHAAVTGVTKARPGGSITATCFVDCGSKTLQQFLTSLTPNESCCQHCLDTCQVSACQSTDSSGTIYCFAD